ncbi:MAG: DUF4870 domain-containing protein [Leucobacter sp.]
MTNLPPEDQSGSAQGPEQTPPIGEPQQPTQPQQPGHGAPQQPGQYQAPQQPPAQQPGQYQAPQQPQQPGQYQAPPQQGYQQPQQPGYQQQGYQQQPATDPVSTITLNYWLSVFFVWIPALIFFIIEKDKTNPLARAYHRDNLNFSLVRTIVWAAMFVLSWIPYLGWILVLLLWLAQIVLFVFHIMAAAKAPEAYRRGEQPSFVFNFPMVK